MSYPRSRRRSGSLDLVGLVILIVIVLAIGVACSATKNSNSEIVSFTVTDKDRVCSGSGSDRSCKYLIFAEDENGNSVTYENTDAILNGKTRSSDLQGCLKVGKTYSGVKVIGFRNGLLSMYKNIISVPGCTD